MGPQVSGVRWVERREDVGRFCREVAPGLYVRSFTSIAEPRGPFARIVLSNAIESASVVAQLFVPVPDFAPIPDEVFECAVAFARYTRKSVPLVVQCRMGLSRSASMAYAILRVVDGLGHAEAFERVRSTALRREWPAPEVIASAQAWVERVTAKS